MMSFSHMPYTLCLEDKNNAYDVGIIGLPFDTATSYRPGARFGPHAIRSGSRRQRQPRGYTQFWGLNPYDYGATFIDCGDVR
jgi:agmatinase